MRCAIYTRVSKDDDGTSASPERQRADCDTEAERRGWEVVERFEDRDLSAYRRSVTRPAYDRMLAAAQQGAYDVVLVWKIDRLVRRAKDLEAWLDLDKVSLASCHDPADTTTATGRAVLRVVASFGQLESEQSSLRIRRALEESARAGRPRKSGRRPFGLTADWSELVPSEAELIREAAERVIAGSSLRSIALDWNSRGVGTVAGQAWKTGTLRRVLLSPRLTGARVHNGSIAALDGDWPTILTPEQQAQVRDVLENPARRTPNRGRTWLMSGIARCGVCGAHLRGRTATDGKLRYACKPKPEGCNRVAILAEVLDRYVVESAQAALDPALARAEEPAPEAPAADGDLEERKADIARMYASGDLSRSEWLAAREALTARELQRRPTHVAPIVEVDIGRFSELPIPQQRIVLAAMLESVTVRHVGRGGRWVAVEDRVEFRWKR